MKNREKYDGFLTECLVNGKKFGVDEATKQPFLCENMECNACKFRNLGKTCANFRTEWLEEEVDIWADFRDLKRGEIIMINVSAFWYPVIFVRFDEFGLRYSRCMNNSGQFVCAVEFEEDPKRIKKVIKEEIL